MGRLHVFIDHRSRSKMAMKLYTFPGNTRALQTLIAAKYNGIDIELPPFSMGVDNKKPDFLAMSPMGKVPVLETSEGCIWEATAISQYVARMRSDTNMYGSSFFESGCVDQWLDFAKNEIDLAMGVWIYPILGFINFNKGSFEKAKGDIKRAFEVLNTHLLTHTYLVGNGVTLADIIVVCSLLNGFKLVFDPQFLQAYPNVVRWFTTCVNQPEFLAVLGETKLCTKAQEAGAAKGGKAEEKKDSKKDKKENKKAAAKEEKKQAPAADAKPSADEKLLKKVIKEGGKKGVEIEGAADMGGLEFFTTQLESPDGDMDLLIQGMMAMNADADPTAEDRKGCAGGVGKLIFSAGTKSLIMIANVPKPQDAKVNIEEWVDVVAASVGGKRVGEHTGPDGRRLVTGEAFGDADKGQFPLKMKDVALSKSIEFLRSKGAFPEDASDDDDDVVFGDDAFDEMNGY